MRRPAGGHDGDVAQGLGTPDHSVEVVEHDPRWAADFAAIAGLLRRCVPEAVVVEHVGSTSVPGMAAKPTIDVLLVVDDLGSVLSRVDELTGLGFDHRPRAFPDEPDHLFLRRVVDGKRTHHLHVLRAGSPEIEEYRFFRDHLIAHPEVAAFYAETKRGLAAHYPTDRLRYVEAKSAVVAAILAEARGEPLPGEA